MLQVTNLKNNKITKTSVTILAAILLGAIGSGFWKHILEPCLYASRDIILNFTTFGIQSFKDSIYIEISMGFHEVASHALFTWLNSLTVYALILFTIYTVWEALKLRREHQELSKQLDMCEKEECDQCQKNREDKSIQGMKRKLQGIKVNLTVKLAYFSIFLTLFFSVAMIASFVRYNYINRAITHYNQLCAISFPYFDDEEEEIIKSKFALIRNSSDYKELTKYLEVRAHKNNIETPNFEIW